MDVRKRIILVSGGVDSTIAWDLYDRFPLEGEEWENIPVFIDYGQPYARTELATVVDMFKLDLDIIKVPIIEPHDKDNPFVPARNLTLASLVASRYNPDEIVMAGLKDDMVVDKNPKAFEMMSGILSQFSDKIMMVVSPFWHLTKGQVVEEFLKSGGDRELLKKTFSCYSDGIEHCNDCPACFRRFVSLESNGIHVVVPSKRMVEKYLSEIHKYDIDRRNRTFIALRDLFEATEAWDIDGILTNEIQGRDYTTRTPRKDNILAMNMNKDNGSMIVLYTSRLESDREVTEQWLKENGAEYHSLIMGKVPYDVIIDDLSQNF